jgi:hypothetical protein
MSNTASHLVDRVLPDVPVRQYVLSLPYELRSLAAFKSSVLTATARIFVEAVFAANRSRAKSGGLSGAECGAVTFVQRYGGSLNLNVHLHVAVLDGVFTRDEQGRVVFHAAPGPTTSELEGIVRRVHRRIIPWLRRRGYIDERPLEERSNARDEQSALEACATVAMQSGSFAKLALDEEPNDPSSAEPVLGARFAVKHEGFDLHAGVRIAAGDDVGRERLCRYGARPAFALGRLRRLRDGRIAYRVKYARAGRAKHRVMAPVEFLARLAALVPPPRFPLVRYHGALGPRSPLRKEIIPKPRDSRDRSATARSRCESTASSSDLARESSNTLQGENQPGPHVRAEHVEGEDASPGAPPPSPAAPRPPAPTPTRPTRKVEDRFPQAALAAKASPALSAPSSGEVTLLAPNILGVRHWARLLDGNLLARSPRVPWALLLQRTFEADVLRCVGCGGRLRVLGSVSEPRAAHAVLVGLGLPTEAPRVARARDPTEHAEYDPGVDE